MAEGYEVHEGQRVVGLCAEGGVSQGTGSIFNRYYLRSKMGLCLGLDTKSHRRLRNQALKSFLSVFSLSFES